MKNNCKCEELFEKVRELEEHGVCKKTLAELANKNGFNASRFGNEYHIANGTYALVSAGAGFAAGCLADGLLEASGLNADIPRWTLDGIAGFAAGTAIYTKAYIGGLLCKQNTDFYNFLKEKYSLFLAKKPANSA